MVTKLKSEYYKIRYITYIIAQTGFLTTIQYLTLDFNNFFIKHGEFPKTQGNSFEKLKVSDIFTRRRGKICPSKTAWII